MLLCPCFLEAGRVTIDDVHWVAQDDRLVPSAQTTYADRPLLRLRAPPTCGSWVEEKTGGAVRAADVLSLGLEDIRRGGPERVREILGGAEARRPVVVNATEYADLEVVVLGLLEAEAAGQTFVYRCGPSFVRVRGGIEPAPPLGADALYARRAKGGGHGLVLVGSHVETTTRQLEHALALDGVHARELSVERLLDPGAREQEIADALGAVEQHLPEREVILYTSRELARAEGSDEALDVGRSVSDALVELVQRLDPGLPLAFCVAKGGITSSDIGTRGLRGPARGGRRADAARDDLGLDPPGRLRLPGAPLRDLPGQRRRGRDARRGHRAARDVTGTRFGSVLAEAAAEGRAVGAFTCYDLLGFEAVVRAAQARAAPVIVLVGPGSFAAEGGGRLVAAFRAAAARGGRAGPDPARPRRRPRADRARRRRRASTP